MKKHLQEEVDEVKEELARYKKKLEQSLADEREAASQASFFLEEIEWLEEQIERLENPNV